MSQAPPPPPEPPVDNQPPIKPAEEQIKPPAIAILVTAILGVVLQAIGLILNLIGIGASGAAQYQQQTQQSGTGATPGAWFYLSAPLGIVGSLIALAGGAFVIFGALRMQKLESYGLAMATAIVAMIPFISPCCWLGLPFGIWALVVINKSEVKAAFGT